MKLMITVFMMSFLVSCVPSYMKQKYTKREPVQPSAESSKQQPQERGGLFSPRTKRPAQPSVYAIDNQTYRFKKGKAEVWDSLISVLLKNYNLTIVDRTDGIITTEWDKFVLNDQYYRNKVSLRLQTVRNGLTEVTVHNSVEKLQSTPGMPAQVWLPTRDEANELHRIIQNVSVVMNLEPPANVKTKFANSGK